RLDPLRPGTFECVGRDVGTGDFLESIDTVGVTCHRVDSGIAVEHDRKRKQKFNIAPAAPLAAHGDRCLTARQQNARRLERLPAPMRYPWVDRLERPK